MSIPSNILRCSVAATILALAPLPASAQQPTEIRAVAQGIANFAVLLVAREKGIFKEQNLEVTWNFISQGALGVEAVFGGSAEIAPGRGCVTNNTSSVRL